MTEFKNVSWCLPKEEFESDKLRDNKITNGLIFIYLK